MLVKRIIPCLDVNKGRVVKGINFFNLEDAGDPIELASRYVDEGADELVFLDITASYEEREIIYDVVKQTADKVNIPFTVGGGIRNLEDIKKLLAVGADKISLNTAAVKDKNLIEKAASKFGSQCIVVAVDVKQVGNEKWEVYINGGRVPAGLDALDWSKQVAELGAGEILLTSMDMDGTKDGYDIEILKRISDIVNIPIIASGGAGELKHFLEALTIGGADAVLAASTFHYGTFTIPQVKEYLKNQGVHVR